MRVVYSKGKRSRHKFMVFSKVLRLCKMKFLDALTYNGFEDLRFYKHDVSLKAALRRIKKQNYPKGTIVRLVNWYCGYADVYVFI